MHYLPKEEKTHQEPAQQKILAEQRQNAESWVRQFNEDPIIPVYTDDEHKPYDAYTVWAMSAAHAYYVGTGHPPCGPWAGLA